MKIFTGRCQSSTSDTRSSRVSRPGVALRAVGAPAGMPRAVIELAQLRQRHLADQAGAVGRAVHPTVVHAHQMAVPGQPDVALHAVGALLQGQLVGGKGVLRTVRRGAPVGHHERMPAPNPSPSGVAEFIRLCCRVSGLRDSTGTAGIGGRIRSSRRSPSDWPAARPACARSHQDLAHQDTSSPVAIR